MPDDKPTNDDQQPTPDPDVMQFLEDRYGDDAQEIDYEPYPDHNFVSGPPDPRPGVFYIRLNAATLEFHQSTDGGDDFVAEIGVDNLHVGTVAIGISLKDACTVAEATAGAELYETMEVLK